jgi:hypothetical protein
MDTLAVSLAAQSASISSQANFLTIGAIAIGIVALSAAVGWGWFVKIWAEKAARDAVTEWMDRNAATEIAKVVADIIPSAMDGRTARAEGDRPPMTQAEQEQGFSGEEA